MERRTFVSMAAGTAMALATRPAAFASGLGATNPVPYPDPAFEILDPRFAKYQIITAGLERLYTGARWAEGPVWVADGSYLLFSDIPNNRMLRWLEETGEVTEFRKPSNYSNGNCRDREGRLVTCEHDTRRVTRTEHNGTVTVLIESFQGKKLNAPNDVVVHSDGAIWFSDPGYGITGNYEGHKATPELPNAVYRLDPKTRVATVVLSDLDKPNGLCFSPDEKLLYVVDSESRQHPTDARPIQVYDVVDGVRLKNGRRFANMAPGASDGIRCDVDGNVWAAAGWSGTDNYNGVHVFAPDGTVIGKIHLPEVCANLCFGGVKRNRLFMTASQSIYSIYVGTEGVALV